MVQELAEAPRPVDHDFDLFYVFSHELQRVEQGCCADNRRAVLVVVHDGNIEFRLEAFLYLEAVRCGNVFEVDAPESGLQDFDRPYELIYVFGIQFDIKDVNVGVNFEQQALALHNGFAGFRADVTQAQHGRPVGNDRYEVPFGRVFIDLFRVIGDFQAGFCYTGGVGKGEVALGCGFFGGNDLNFPRAPLGMVVQGFFS